MNSDQKGFNGAIDYDLIHAIEQFNETYGINVSASLKRKGLLKFGESLNVQTTPTTLMDLPAGVFNETYVHHNIIDTISSSSAADLGALKIEGHTVGNDLSITSLTQVAGLATATIVGHGFMTGEWVSIDGAVQTEYNGLVEVTVLDADTFTFSVDVAAVTPATGTITGTSQKLVFVVQTATLNGQNKVVLGTPLARMSRMYLSSQDRVVDLVGSISGYEDTPIVAGVPTDGTKVHCMIRAGKNNSLKASTTISSTDAYIITSVSAHMLQKTSSFADLVLEIRDCGGAWRAIDNLGINSSSSIATLEFRPYIIIPPSSDIRLISTADANGRDVGGSFQGYLAKVTD